MKVWRDGSWHKSFIHQFFHAWDEFWGYWLMHLGDKNYLINQTQIAYICLCGSSRVSSTVFLADKNRGCQLHVWDSGQISIKGWKTVNPDICRQRRVWSEPPEESD